MNIFCAWELGSNLGHLARLRGVAEALDAAGHKVSLALADLSRAGEFFDSKRMNLLQAPLSRQKLRMNRQLASLADVLTLYGYNTPEGLAGLVSGWESLMALTGADLLVADHAPTAQLAAQRMGIPALIVGNGFTLPEAGEPLPDWRPIPTQDDLVLAQESRVLKHINALLPPQAPMRRLSELYRCQGVLIDSVPLIDPQAAVRRNACYCAGVRESGGGGGEVWFEATGREKVGVYLHPSYSKLIEVCEALARLDADVVVLCPQAGEDIVTSMGAIPGIRVVHRFVDMASLMAASDWFMSHGGLGTATLCLRQGKPQVVLPTQMEQLNTAVQLQRAGLAHILPELESSQAYERAFRGSRPDQDMRLRAAAFPADNQSSLQRTLPDALLESIAALSARPVAPAVPPSHP